MGQKMVMVLLVVLAMVAMVDPRSVIPNAYYVEDATGHLSFTKIKELMLTPTVMEPSYNGNALKLQ